MTDRTKKTSLPVMILFAVIITVMALWAWVPADKAVFADDKASVSVEASNMKVGETGTVTITYSGNNIGRVDAILNYDNSVISYVSGGSSSGDEGTVVLSLAGTGEDLVFELTFKAVSAGNANISVVTNNVYNIDEQPMGYPSDSRTITVEDVQVTPAEPEEQEQEPSQNGSENEADVTHDVEEDTEEAEGGLNTMTLIMIALAALLVALVIIIIVLISRRNKKPMPPAGIYPPAGPSAAGPYDPNGFEAEKKRRSDAYEAAMYAAEKERAKRATEALSGAGPKDTATKVVPPLGNKNTFKTDDYDQEMFTTKVFPEKKVTEVKDHNDLPADDDFIAEIDRDLSNDNDGYYGAAAPGRAKPDTEELRELRKRETEMYGGFDPEKQTDLYDETTGKRHRRHRRMRKNK